MKPTIGYLAAQRWQAAVEAEMRAAWMAVQHHRREAKNLENNRAGFFLDYHYHRTRATEAWAVLRSLAEVRRAVRLALVLLPGEQA